MDILVNGETYRMDVDKAQQLAGWYERKELHIAWVMSGGMLGKYDPEFGVAAYTSN